MSTGRVLAMALAVAVAAFVVGRFTATKPPPAATDDLAGAIQASLAERDVLERLGRTATLLGTLESHDLPSVLAVYERMIPSIQPPELGEFFDAWARFDPVGAIEYALAFPRRTMLEERRIGVRAALAGWAYTDPPKARAAAEEMAERYAPLRDHIWTGLVAGWVRADPGSEQLAPFLADLLPQSRRDAAAEVAVREMVRIAGAEAALSWADTILDDGYQKDTFKRAVFESSVRTAMASDPARTSAWVLEQAEADYAVDGPLIAGGIWGRADGAAALAWLGAYPAGEPRDKGIREAFLAWSTVDWDGAGAWLESIDQTALRDLALQVWAEQLIAWEPAEALAGCERIADAARQQRCLASGAKRWYAKDAVAAEEWLQSSPLDEEARSQVRNSAGNLGSRARRPRARGGAQR